MKVLFTADLQLGVGQNLGHGEYGPGSRFQDQVDNLDKIAALAVEHQVGLVGVLGDVFERSRPAPWEILAYQNFVRTLNNHGIRVLTILGNHDVRSAALPSALGIFHGNGCDVALNPSIYDYGDVVIAALPWTPTTRLIAQRPADSTDSLNDLAAQALEQAAHVLSTRCEVEFAGRVPILVGHWGITGAALPTGLDVATHLREPLIALDGLAQSGFALAAFGHIHKAQVLANGPTPVFYCGSPTVCNWGESAVEHGVWLYDTEGAGALKFLPVADRPFVTLDRGFIELPFGLGFDEPAGDVEGALVRVRYTVTEEQARRVDQTAIRKTLMENGAVKVFFQPTVERTVRSRVAVSATEGVSETDGLEFWLASQEVADPDGLRALHAEYVTRVA